MSIKPRNNPLGQIGQWIDALDIQNVHFARLLCQLIPAHCPFEQNIAILGHSLIRIPPMCKLNPLYEQFMGLRFRASSYLADEQGEEVRFSAAHHKS